MAWTDTDNAAARQLLWCISRTHQAAEAAQCTLGHINRWHLQNLVCKTKKFKRCTRTHTCTMQTSVAGSSQLWQATYIALYPAVSENQTQGFWLELPVLWPLSYHNQAPMHQPSQSPKCHVIHRACPTLTENSDHGIVLVLCPTRTCLPARNSLVNEVELPGLIPKKW